MQTFWKEKYEWDQPLPETFKKKWNEIVQELHKTLTMEILRYYFPDTIATNSTEELHVFTDSRLVAYGACAYIVKDNQSSLVISRNRVAPMR